MLGRIDTFREIFESRGLELITPPVVQTLSEDELIQILPGVDGWIIGDDPASRRVLQAGKAGRLKACVKWGVGVDNVDFAACKDFGIPVTNTPLMFGEEVADIALHYVIALARQTFWVDREVRQGRWPKPAGISTSGKTAALIGFGDIGRATAHRLQAIGMEIMVYDPFAQINDEDRQRYTFHPWPQEVEKADFLVVTASLTPASRHMVNEETFRLAKPGLRVVNVSRGPVIRESALIEALQSGKVFSAALDVFETEPLPADSPLRQMEQCIFGTHNGSNTSDAVHRASMQAIRYLFDFLNLPKP